MKIGWLLASHVSLTYFTKDALLLPALSSDKYLAVLAEWCDSHPKYLQSTVYSGYMGDLQGRPLWASFSFFGFSFLRTTTTGADQLLAGVTNGRSKHKFDSQFVLTEDPWTFL